MVLLTLAFIAPFVPHTFIVTFSYFFLVGNMYSDVVCTDIFLKCFIFGPSRNCRD